MPGVTSLTAERIEELLALKADLALLDDFVDNAALTDGLATKADLVSGRVEYSQLPTDLATDSELSTGLSGKADLVSGRVEYSQLPTDIGTDGDISSAISSYNSATVSPGLTARPTKTDLDMDASNNVQLTGHFAGIPTPAEQGFAAWTYPPEHIQAGGAGTAGAMYLSQFYIAKQVTITKIGWGIATAGSGAVSNQNKIGIYAANGVLQCSVDVTSRVATAGAWLETVSSTVLTPGAYWICFLFNASSMPQVMRGSTVSTNVANLGRTAGTLRFGVGLTGQTSLPGSYSVSSNVTNAVNYWGCVAV